MAVSASEIASPPVVDTSLDERIVTLTIEVNGRVTTYQDLFIAATGVKYGNPLQNECEITIYNLDRETQDYILTETTPYNSNFTPKTVTLSAGRKSYGTTVIFTGNIIYASVSQPPDVGVTVRCLTANFLKSFTISRNQPALASLETIAKAIAADANLTLLFQATNKDISNYIYVGSTLQQLEALAALGQLNVFIDDDTIVVKNAFEPLAGKVVQVNASTGMIGIPEFTERGVRVKMLIDNKVRLGGAINLYSEVYPAVNGIFVIYQLAFQITNRLVPFYYIADCFRIAEPNLESTSG